MNNRLRARAQAPDHASDEATRPDLRGEAYGPRRALRVRSLRHGRGIARGCGARPGGGPEKNRGAGLYLLSPTRP